MLVDQRRQQILEITEKGGFVSLAQLVERVGASESTVRRDLEFLDGIGQIRRTRGGAAYVGESLTSFDVRRTQAREQKERHCRGGRRPGRNRAKRSFSTAGRRPWRSPGNWSARPLQVVTNSIPIVNVLVNSPQTELIVIGGFLYPKTGVNLGPIAVEALKSIHARRLFISVGGITAAGLFNSNALLVETERQMIEAAEEVIVVSDSSKLGHSALAQLCPLDVGRPADRSMTGITRRMETDRAAGRHRIDRRGGASETVAATLARVDARSNARVRDVRGASCGNSAADGPAAEAQSAGRQYFRPARPSHRRARPHSLRQGRARADEAALPGRLLRRQGDGRRDRAAVADDSARFACWDRAAAIRRSSWPSPTASRWASICPCGSAATFTTRPAACWSGRPESSS